MSELRGLSNDELNALYDETCALEAELHERRLTIEDERYRRVFKVAILGIDE